MIVTKLDNLMMMEKERSDLNWLPKKKVNFQVGTGEVTLKPINDKYTLIINGGSVNTGTGEFYVGGDLGDSGLYDQLLIKSGSLTVDDTLTISDNGVVTVGGNLIIGNGGKLTVTADGIVRVLPGGSLRFEPGSELSFTDSDGNAGGSIRVDGTLFVDPDQVTKVLRSPRVNVGMYAIVRLSESPLSRTYSLTDCLADLWQRDIPYGKYGYQLLGYGSKLSFVQLGGDHDNPWQILNVHLSDGDIPFGDFNLMIAGLPSYADKLKLIGDLTIGQDAHLHVSDNYRGETFYRPMIRVSPPLGHTPVYPPKLQINGKLTVSGEHSVLRVEHGGLIVISQTGQLNLMNGSTIRSNEQDGGTLLINGILKVEDITQLSHLEPYQIVFGSNGQLTITNEQPNWDSRKRKVLLSIPDGIQESELYRLLGDRLEHVEYHVPSGCGISIDRYMEQFYRLDDWYGGMRLEEAIQRGYIVWHSGAFINLDRSIIPWVDLSQPVLMQIPKLFLSHRESTPEKLQDLVNRLYRAKCGNMVFMLTDKTRVEETTLDLSACKIQTAGYDQQTSSYTIVTSGDGELLITNSDKISSLSVSDIVKIEPVAIPIPETKASFTIP